MPTLALRRLGVALLLAGVLAPPGAGGQPAAARAAALRADLDSFFKALGLEDFSGQIQESLDKGQALNEIGVDTLKNNLRRYAMVNEARQIAVILLVDAEPRLREEGFRSRFLPFAAGFLTLKPLAPPLELPQGVKDGGPQAVDAFLERAARDNMRRQAEAVLSDCRSVFSGPAKTLRQDKGRLSDLLTRYVMRVYLDPQIGNTHWLGRALLLGLARYSAIHEDKALLDALRAEVERRGLFLENYVGSTLVLAGKDGVRRVPVETGDLVFERSRDIKESAAIAAAALPEDTGRAAKMGLTGSLMDTVWDVPPEARTNGLSRLQRRRLLMAQQESHSNGMSHVGQLAVYRDARTGLEQVLIWDDYPYSVHLNIDKDEEWGGVRLNGLEHFANPGDVMRVGVVTVDKEKLFRMAKDRFAAKAAEIQSRGWSKSAWESFVPKINQDRAILPQASPARHDWEYQISQDEFFALHGLADQEAWLKSYHALLLKGWRTMLTQWGIWFNWIDAGAGLDDQKKYRSGRYWYGGMYCSEAVNSASLLFAGLNLEVRPSHYSGYLAWAQRAGIQKAKQLDLKAPVIAPSSLALQPYSNPMVQVIYPPYTLAALAQAHFQVQTASSAVSEEGLVSQELIEGPLNRGEQEALVARERTFLEFANLEGGRGVAQIFGKGQEPRKREHDRADVVDVGR